MIMSENIVRSGMGKWKDAIIFLLILLFAYTAVSKLIDYNGFVQQMYNQTLPRILIITATYTLPEAELLACAFLLFSRTKLIGLWMSLIMLLIFTIYIGLILGHFFPWVPCSCGGVIAAMGWHLHFYFNLFFMLLNFMAINFTYQERRKAGRAIR
jgi:putative oxidoreductase